MVKNTEECSRDCPKDVHADGAMLMQQPCCMHTLEIISDCGNYMGMA